MKNILIIASILLSVVQNVHSQWSTDTAINNPVVDDASSQYNPNVTYDGNGGAIIVWRDRRNEASGNGKDIYIQRFDQDGVEQWAHNGIRVCDATGDQEKPHLVSDGAGGAIVFWQDDRGADTDIYAQRVDVNGNLQWTTSGKSVCTATGAQYLEGSGYTLMGYVVSDGSGGAVVCWEDSRGSDKDVYAQRINSSGTAQWTANGIQVTSMANDDRGQRIEADGLGNYIFCWENYDTSTGASNVYLQRLNGSGVLQWGASPVNAFPAGLPWPGKPSCPEIVTDGNGGVYVVASSRAGLSTGNLYMQSIDSNGTLLWGSYILLRSSTQDNELYWKLVPDPSDGFVVAWRGSYTAAATDYDIHAQRVDSNGNLLWGDTANPLVISNATGYQGGPEVIEDGCGNTIITWWDNRSGNYDIYAQKINSSGVDQWTANGVPVTTNASTQYLAGIATNGDCGFVSTWADNRSGWDIYASNVNSDGTLGANSGYSAPLPVTLLSFSGYFNNGTVFLNWTTASESNNDYFIIEKSTDGINFSQVGMVPGSGTTNDEITYNFTDIEKMPGVIYYRLTQVDFDGSETQFNVISIMVGVAGKMDVYPNPSSGIFTIIVTDGLQKIEITSMTGQMLYSKVIIEDNQTVTMDISEFKKGQYILTAICDDKRYVKRVIKK